MKRSLILLTCSVFLFGQIALGESPPPAQFEVNPDTLRVQLLEKNLSLIQALNGVKDAKDQVSVARGNLLPSINLGGLISSAHTFVLSTVQFLLPFLLPSNWFNYKAQKETFEAQKLSYYILELNTYSSALSLYYTMLGDQETEEVYAAEADAMESIVKDQAKQAGMGTLVPSDLLQLQTQAELAGVQASVLRGLVGQELASLRAALALPVLTQLTLAKTTTPTMAWEPKDPTQFSPKDLQGLIDQANRIAPERSQIKFLVDAAKAKKWSTVFGFINGATLAAQSNAPAGASLSKLYGSVNVNLGFALFPSIKIANRNVQEIQLLDDQLIQSNTQVLEGSTKSFLEAKVQYDLASSAEANSNQIYNLKLTQYAMGVGTFVDILVAFTQKTQSSLGRIQAETNLNIQRVIFERAFLTDQFSKIQPCKKISPKVKKGQTLDQLCRS